MPCYIPNAYFVVYSLHESRNVGFDIGWDGNHSLFANQKLSIKVPRRIPGAGFGLEKLPNLGGVASQDVSQFHEGARKFLLGGKCGNLSVVAIFLAAKFLAWKGQNDEFVPIFLPERFELGILASGGTSFGGNVGGIHDLASAVFHGERRAVALGGGKRIKRSHSSRSDCRV